MTENETTMPAGRAHRVYKERREEERLLPDPGDYRDQGTSSIPPFPYDERNGKELSLPPAGTAAILSLFSVSLCELCELERSGRA